MQTDEEKLNYCGQQIKRLASKPKFPWDETGIEELAHTLHSYTKSQGHAKRVIDAAVLKQFGPPDRPEERCPGPSELWALCKEIAPEGPSGAECSPGCPDCSGSRWRQIVREDGISAAVYCDCGDRPASEESMARYWAMEKKRIASAEREATAKWKERMAEDFAAAVARSKIAPLPGKSVIAEEFETETVEQDG